MTKTTDRKMSEELKETETEIVSPDDAIVMCIACAIVSYESDVPHVEVPDFKPDNDEYYPEISFEDIKVWQEMEHHGDCINMPATCMRCIADEAIHKAEFIASKITV